MTASLGRGFLVVSKDIALFALAHDPCCDLEAAVTGAQKQPQLLIRGTGGYLGDGSAKNISSDEPLIVTGTATADRLAVIRVLPPDNLANRKRTRLCFDLTSNQLLVPFQIALNSHTGRRSIKTIRQRKITVQGLGSIRFTNHYYETRAPDSRGPTTCRKLVGEARIDIPAIDILNNEQFIRDAIEPLILLAALAARQATVIPSWSATDKQHHVSCYAGNIFRPSYRSNSSHHDLLIDESEFNQFVIAGLGTFGLLDPYNKEIVKRTIYKVLPDPDKTIETRFLSLFSALESLVLVFRRHNDLEFTISDPLLWKELAGDFKSFVKQHRVWSSCENAKLLLATLPALRRIPLKYAFAAYCKHYQLDMSDLWPTFGDGVVSLSTIRNKLMHNDAYPRFALDALIRAKSNLEVTVERMLLVALGWPIDSTKVRPISLKSLGWKANASIDQDMRTLATAISNNTFENSDDHPIA